MKKYLLSLPILGACAFGIANVDAKELDLVNRVDSNTYIIGNRVFELNNYYLTITDIINAGIEYQKINGGDTAPVYYLYENANGDRNLLLINGRETTEIALNEVYPDGKMEATALNGKIFDGVQISTAFEDIKKTINEINANASAYGLNSLVLDHNTTTWINTITANVNDLNKDVMDYVNSDVKDLFVDILNVARNGGVRYVTIAGQDIRLDDSTNVLKEAYKVLSGLIDENQDLVLGSLIGKEIVIDVHYEGDGEEVTEYYRINFNYDLDVQKDKEVNKVINKLNSEFGNNQGYGVESIAYDNATNTATVKLSDNTDLLENEDALTAKFDEILAKYENQINVLLSDVADITVSAMGLTLVIDNEVTENQIEKFLKDLYIEISDENGNISMEQIANLKISLNVNYIVDNDVNPIEYFVAFTK